MLPDPTLTASYTNEGLSHLTYGESPDANLTVTFTQELPYPGKRRLAGDVARAQVGLEEARIESLRFRVAAEVKTLYAELRRIDRSDTILEEARELVESILAAARARYETGEGILENLLRAQVERTRIDAERSLLAQDRRSAEVALVAVLGRSSDTPLGRAVDAPTSAPVDLRELEEAAVEQAPELLELRAASRREEARLELSRREMKPDLMWGASYASRGSLDPMVMGMFGVRLPLWRDRKQAKAVAQTERELDAARRDTSAGEARVRGTVRDLAARAARAEALLQLYREGILPQSRGALDAAAAAYGAGRAEFVTLVEDFLAVLRYEIEAEAQDADRIRSLVALETLTGRTLVLPGDGSRLASIRGGDHE